MLSKSQIKLIRSLGQKKYRSEHQLFVVEGAKAVAEFMGSGYELEHVFSVDHVFDISTDFFTSVSAPGLKKISFLKTPNKVLALFKIPKPKPINYSRLVVALDDLRDPGNLGTIIRLCDWFGVLDLICSRTTVDCYNPKVIQASMGSLSRVNISYCDLEKTVPLFNNSYGTYMNETSVYDIKLNKPAIVVFGNEARGISSSLEPLFKNKVSIPRYSAGIETESLNVANAAAIFLAEFRRGITEK